MYLIHQYQLSFYLHKISNHVLMSLSFHYLIMFILIYLYLPFLNYLIYLNYLQYDLLLLFLLNILASPLIYIISSLISSIHFLNITSNSDLLYISLIYNYFNSLTLFFSLFNVDYKDFIVFSDLNNVY